MQALVGCLGRFMGDMGVSRVSQKNSDKLLGNLEFPKTFGRNAYGCMEGLTIRIFAGIFREVLTDIHAFYISTTARGTASLRFGQKLSTI